MATACVQSIHTYTHTYMFCIYVIGCAVILASLLVLVAMILQLFIWIQIIIRALFCIYANRVITLCNHVYCVHVGVLPLCLSVCVSVCVHTCMCKSQILWHGDCKMYCVVCINWNFIAPCCIVWLMLDCGVKSAFIGQWFSI